MDLSHPQSNLSLGFSSHASPPHRTQIADDSISLQLDSSLRDPTHSVTPIPLQLLEPQAECQRTENGNLDRDMNDDDDDDDEDREVEEFRILGHSMCLKRRRDSESSSSSASATSNSKRVSFGPDLEARRSAVRLWGDQPLRIADPDVFHIMEKEKRRQFKGIELIASENFVCKAVMEALGSHLTNKYSEGMPGARYYCGNQHIDEIETLCCERALAAFNLDSENWGVNVQPYSCTSANFAVYTGLLLPGDRIMGLDTPCGGNTSHGYYLPNGRKVSGASIFFESLSYKVNPQTGYIDYEKLEERALDFRPKILICGGSSYPREWEYSRFRQIADKCGAVLMCDMAQISGLISAKECANPFEYCDIVTSTTHKSLRGPRGGIIFFRKGTKPRKRGILLNQGDESEQYDFEEKINFAVFPAMQGGPHNNHIAALAIALKQVATPEYKAYMHQVKKNAQALASALKRKNFRLVTGGTDNHLLIWDLRPLGLTGKIYEKVCEMCHITLNKIAIFGDNGTIVPRGVRIGTPAMTSRGCVEGDFETIAEFLYRAAQIATAVHREHGNQQKAYLKALENNKDIVDLRMRVETFASQFALPGFDG
ncbi:serine hydroxymethyltransferase 7 [Ziziphus jujuba]|uniref:Serine hydroxymethyltransferase n=1 Tax=Ziziphus jujuba TaxID=326968 RepID=A0A6P3ZJJ4_ZIZJJ|nr:serine hydroxymethyltransferase 7 [Ziziphus jujuba]